MSNAKLIESKSGIMTDMAYESNKFELITEQLDVYYHQL